MHIKNINKNHIWFHRVPRTQMERPSGTLGQCYITPLPWVLYHTFALRQYYTSQCYMSWFVVAKGVTGIMWDIALLHNILGNSRKAVMLFIPLFLWPGLKQMPSPGQGWSRSHLFSSNTIKWACVSLCVCCRFETTQILEPRLSRIGLALHFPFFNTWFSLIILFLSCVSWSETMLCAEIRPALLQNREFHQVSPKVILSILFEILRLTSMKNYLCNSSKVIENENNLTLQQIYVTSRLCPELQWMSCSPSVMMLCSRLTRTCSEWSTVSIICLINKPMLLPGAKEISADSQTLIQTQLWLGLRLSHSGRQWTPLECLSLRLSAQALLRYYTS